MSCSWDRRLRHDPVLRYIVFAEGTEDEMCFNFVLAWPAGSLSNAAGQSGRRCIGRAP